MSKLYALFPDEHAAKNAIGAIEKENKNAKINLFSAELKPIENSVYQSAQKIIGSPSGMFSPFTSKDAAGGMSATAQSEFSAFVYAGLTATHENSLNESAANELSLPSDAYGAGLKINISSQDKPKIEKILLNNGATIV